MSVISVEIQCTDVCLGTNIRICTVHMCAHMLTEPIEKHLNCKSLRKRTYVFLKSICAKFCVVSLSLWI